MYRGLLHRSAAYCQSVALHCALAVHCGLGLKQSIVQVNAVDSEFTGVQQDDQCRLIAAMSSMAKAGHPLRTFMWGNKRSLWTEPKEKGIAVRERIVEHYKRHYSASRMRLVLISGQPLDLLQEWTEELFAPVRICFQY